MQIYKALDEHRQSIAPKKKFWFIIVDINASVLVLQILYLTYKFQLFQLSTAHFLFKDVANTVWGTAMRHSSFCKLYRP